MLSWPTAVARLEPPAARANLHGRLVELIDGASRGERRGLVERLLPATTSHSGGSAIDESGFSWLVVPKKLAETFGMDQSPEARALLHDLSWLQYCVYGVFRVQDDLVDGDSDDATLAVQTNHLLVEAARCASAHFPGESSFWRAFQEGIDQTSNAIVALDRLQRSAERRAEEELELYAQLSACLKIAAAGVTLAAGHERLWWDQLSPALDGFAVAAQIVDDLHDLGEDLAQGRINHAAWFLSHPIYGSTPEATEAVVASNLATTDRADRLLESAATRMEAALTHLDAQRCPNVYTYLLDYLLALDELSTQIRERKRTLLSERPASYSATSGSTQNR